MRLHLTGRNLEITPALRQLVERRLARLERLLGDSIVSAQIVLHYEKFRRVSDVTLHARGDHILRGVSEAETWPSSLKGAADKITQQAQRLKGKWRTRKRRAVAARTLAATAATRVKPADRAEAPPRIIRASRYAVKPMSVEDAALRVPPAPNAFLVFRDDTTDAINILYRRNDGHFGLIEPES